jgi:hypothetical protein
LNCFETRLDHVLRFLSGFVRADAAVGVLSPIAIHAKNLKKWRETISLRPPIYCATSTGVLSTIATNLSAEQFPPMTCAAIVDVIEGQK